MSDDVAFLAALKAAPDDDTIRLVFADWLDERGRRGGELMRSECALAALPLDAPEWAKAFARYQRACEGLSEQWRESLSRYSPTHWLGVSARSAWARLENWCRQHHPRLLEELRPPASNEQIELIQRHVWLPLPTDLRESFAIHNGGGRLIFGCELLTVESIVGEWVRWRSVAGHNDDFRERHTSFPEGAVALDYTNAGWVPLTRGASSNHIGVDLAPGPKGTHGQVIIFGRDEDHKCVLASGWAEFLSDYAAFLESGAIGEIDENSRDPDSSLNATLNTRHPHDVLRKWRREGFWPPK